MNALATTSIAADAAFPALRDFIVESTGMAYYADRPESLAGLLAGRFQQRCVAGCPEYLELLQEEFSGAAELDSLVELLTIGETFFFRHHELFDALRDVVLPEIIRRNHSMRRLRVWSAGCSNGAEAYTVSILLRRDLERLSHGWDISILGTDINRSITKKARKARYEEWAFRGTPPEFRSECFTRRGRHWELNPRFKAGVAFAQHNLVQDAYPPPCCGSAAFDLILCRNVLIYFGAGLVKQVVAKLRECLVTGGWLAVGHAEHTGDLRRVFDAVTQQDVTLYRKAERLSEPKGPALTELAAGASAPRVDPMLWVTEPKQTEAVRRFKPPATATHPARTNEPLCGMECLHDLVNRGQTAQALEQCESLIQTEPLNPVGHFYQGVLLAQASNHTAAQEALLRSIYLDRRFALAYYYLGLTQQSSGAEASALKSFNNVLRLLAGREQAEVLPHVEGLTVADLEGLARIHLQALERT